MRKLLLLSLIVMSFLFLFNVEWLFAEGKPVGDWYLIKATYEDEAVEGFEANINFLDEEYYEASFTIDWHEGRAEAIHNFSANNDTLFNELPTIDNTWGGNLPLLTEN